MAKFLYARTASDDAVCVNVDFIKDIAIDGDGSLHIGWTADAGDAGVIECTVSTGDAAEKNMCITVAKAIANNRQAVITLRDDVTGDTLHSDITAVGTITPSS
tara:strand:+ start:153 stop:461 length:309 start_codon:yes stop_codon:yes gene_type:complete